MSSQFTQNPNPNRLLAALPATQARRLAASLELTQVELGQILYESDDSQKFVYFPTSCLVSLIVSTENGASSELAMTGNDGLVGIPLVLGGLTTTHSAVVQTAGEAYRMRADAFARELAEAGELNRLALGYAQALMTQMAQSVVCNRHHTADQQLSRWLLQSLDRLPGDQIDMTHESIAELLGRRRETITGAATKLQTAGIIKYYRGHIIVTDRAALESRACECYCGVKSEYERLFDVSSHACDATQLHVSARFDSEGDSAGTQLDRQENEFEDGLESASGPANDAGAQYMEIYDFSPIAQVTVGEDGAIQRINLAGAILLGIKGSESANYEFTSFIKPECMATFEKFEDDVLTGKANAQCELVLAASAQRAEAWVRVQAGTDESARELRLMLIDITAQKETERILKESHSFALSLIDALPAQVGVIDGAGKIVAINQALRKDGGKDNDLVGKNYAALCESIIGADSDDAPRVASGIRSVVRGLTNEFVHEFASEWPSDSSRHCVRVNRFSDNSLYSMVTHFEIPVASEQVAAPSHSALRGFTVRPALVSAARN